MFEKNKKALLSALVGGMVCLFVPVCWFVMNGPDKHKVNTDSEGSGQFYYSTLSEITGEEAKCVAWGTGLICVSGY